MVLPRHLSLVLFYSPNCTVTLVHNCCIWTREIRYSIVKQLLYDALVLSRHLSLVPFYSRNGMVTLVHNCYIWTKENLHGIVEKLLYHVKIAACCGFTSSFIIGSFLCKELYGDAFQTVSVSD